MSIVQAKTDDYLSYGAEQVWVVYPEGKQLHLHDRATPDIIRVYHVGDTFSDCRLFPDLDFPLAAVFTLED